MYIERAYRKKMGEGRFKTFTVGFKDTDLWIGVAPSSYSPEMKLFILNKITELRNDILGYAQNNKNFLESYFPLKEDEMAPQLVKEMLVAGRSAKIGPMGSVAGGFAQFVGQAVSDEFGTSEIIVENGGDIYFEVNSPITISVFAGQSTLSEKIGITIPSNYSPLGVCTSSGTVGPSHSYGKADAVMICCKNTLLADAYATAFGNKIKTPDDIEPILDKIGKITEILSAIIIIDDKIGIRGQFALEVF